jgi:hypothetical protein
MTSWKRQFLVWRERQRRDSLSRKNSRIARQQSIKTRKIHMSKDLSIGHNLGEFNLHPEDFLLTMRVLSGKMISWVEIEKMFKKYR